MTKTKTKTAKQKKTNTSIAAKATPVREGQTVTAGEVAKWDTEKWESLLQDGHRVSIRLRNDKVIEGRLMMDVWDGDAVPINIVDDCGVNGELTVAFNAIVEITVFDD